MKKITKRNSLWLVLFHSFLLFFLASCSQDEEELISPTTSTQTEEMTIVNNWIYDVMSEVYFWNDEVTRPGRSSVDPEDYFYSLLDNDDRFSYITDDYEALAAEFSGVYTSMGFSPSFGLLSASNEVFIAVEYVYPNSPADRAGLQRGDIILEIDGQPMTTENYYDLYAQDQYTVTLGTYDGYHITLTDNTRDLRAAVIQTDPVLYKEVKTYNNVKVGYIVYTEFISGDNDQWINSLGETMDEFSQQGVSELVVDLRYNPGGEISAAQFIASALAPASVVANSDVLVRFEYNEALETAIERQEGRESSSLVNRLFTNGYHLDLNRVIFLTASGTASASELLINGLDPYMDVVMIGEPTVGKFYGSWVIPDTEDPARHNWAIMPIVMKYANANGVTDFADGLTPDYLVEDNLLSARPFGDENDPMLGLALAITTGEFNARKAIPTEKGIPYTPLENPEKEKKSRLFIEGMNLSEAANPAN